MIVTDIVNTVITATKVFLGADDTYFSRTQMMPEALSALVKQSRVRLINCIERHGGSSEQSVSSTRRNCLDKMTVYLAFARCKHEDRFFISCLFRDPADWDFGHVRIPLPWAPRLPGG